MRTNLRGTVYPKKYAHGFCFAVLCCGYTLTDFPISIRLTSLALWQSNDCPSANKATLKNMDKYFMWIHYERLHNHNKAKHNKTVCIFLGIYCRHRTITLQCSRSVQKVIVLTFNPELHTRCSCQVSQCDLQSSFLSNQNTILLKPKKQKLVPRCYLLYLIWITMMKLSTLGEITSDTDSQSGLR